jgi:hypothetical protein
MAPRLGWQETKDYAAGWAQGAAQGAGHAAAGLWQLASAPVESLRPWVTAPLKTFQKYSQADQDTTRAAIVLARAGQFQPAGHQMGEQMGSTVASQVLSAAGQAAVGKVVQEMHALRRTNHAVHPAQAVLQRPLQRLSEIQAHREALRLERIDHGHSLDRHGPQLTEADHTRRVTQGIAADNVYSPTAVSTQFHTASDWLCTREKAIRYAEAQYGISQGQAPNLSRGQPSSYEVILEFTRPIDSGAVGTGPQHTVRNPRTGQTKKMPSQALGISGVTRTKTTLQWDATQNRWVVAQHMPYAKGWDDVRKMYAPESVVHARGVELHTD